MKASHLIISGIVQGVGFRPRVWQLAQECGLAGWVNNASDGVHIHIEGTDETVDGFPALLEAQAPTMSHIASIQEHTATVEGYDGFEIRASDGSKQVSTLVSPDIATCPDCIRELFDTGDRRWHYPFINCTQCGPRFTIIDSMPYDRPHTSMKGFAMCPDCTREYHDPSNRRFHAQPDACFDCGPQLTWLDRRAGEQIQADKAHDAESSDALINKAAALLDDGGIVAIKGLGGYHLACDAQNEDAVALLRQRKRRPTKPFAIMVPTVEAARLLCEVNAVEAGLLCGSVRPIVLLARKGGEGTGICEGVAGRLAELGIMLPYTPVQHLLLQAFGRPLVMTSGNLTEEPIVAEDGDAQDTLGAIADAFLGNDRAILSRYDDSVVRVIDNKVVMVRRARGYAPVPLTITGGAADDEDKAPVVLACGPEQKNTFCLAQGSRAFCSQHLGDLENAQTFEVWQDTVDLYQRLFDLTPTQLVCDMHPGYLSTKWAHEQHRLTGTPCMEVQHHHAHIAAVCAEHGIEERVIGVALDGTGYGDDGAIWGGELLLCDLCNYERLAHLRYLPLVGGAGAIRHPERMAAAALIACGLADHPGAYRLKSHMGEEQWGIVRQMVERKINCPPTSSAGRLLDAVAALVGICTEASYDGEPAISLEAALYADDARPGEQGTGGAPSDAALLGIQDSEGGPYPFELVGLTVPFVIDPAKALEAALQDMVCECSPKTIARRFHEGFALAIVDCCVHAAKINDTSVVALSGGVFMNRFLLRHIRDELKKRGLHVICGKELPANDGCISYGQAAVALARLRHQA